jgi:hypothetical protein
VTGTTREPPLGATLGSGSRDTPFRGSGTTQDEVVPKSRNQSKPGSPSKPLLTVRSSHPTKRVLSPLEEKALYWRHAQVVKVLRRLDADERLAALLAVVAPDEDLLRLSMAAVAGEIPTDEAQEQLELFEAMA